jgi:hypothetical protein
MQKGFQDIPAHDRTATTRRTTQKQETEMTRYPINFEYDRSFGSLYDGAAATADEARAIMSDLLTEAAGMPTVAPEPYIASTEAGPVGTEEQVRRWWADEIAAGWVTPIRVYGGYVAQVEHWTVTA